MFSWPGPDSMIRLRSFWAFELPDGIREQLRNVQAKLKPLYPNFKWVKPENIHLTLHFMGDLSTQDLVKQVEYLQPVLAKKQPFPAALGKMGVFPGWSNPRVLWIGLEGSQKPLNDLHRVTSGVLRELGSPPENRRFSPHITLARIKDIYSGLPLEPTGINENAPRNNEIFLLESLTLFTSRLGPGGPQYTPWHSFQLQKLITEL